MTKPVINMTGWVEVHIPAEDREFAQGLNVLIDNGPAGEFFRLTSDGSGAGDAERGVARAG